MEAQKHHIGKIFSTEYTVKLDKMNQKLLSELMSNARTPNSVLAQKIKLSKSNIGRRIANLEKEGVISGYHAFIDVSKLGMKSCIVFIHTRCTEDEKQVYLNDLNKLSNVFGAIESTGKYDLFIYMHYSDNEQREEVIEQILKVNFIKDFKVFDFITLFPKLDYTKKIFEPGPSPSVLTELKSAIDKTDLEILKILSEDCRTTLTDMSQALGISRETVNYRMKKLVNSGVIAKFQPTVSFFRLGFEAYILTLRLSKPSQKNRVINYLKETYRCNTILRSDTGLDILAFIHFNSNKEFRDFENKLTEKFKDVIYEYSFEFIKQQHKLHWLPKELDVKL